MAPWHFCGLRGVRSHCAKPLFQGRRSNDQRPRAGFTLIEVILVSVVLALLLASSLPRFQQTASRLRAEQVAFELAQLLRVAHAWAISEGQETVWRWDDAARRARVEPGSEQGESPTGIPPVPAGRLTESARIPDALHVLLTQQGEPVPCRCVHFFPDGTSESIAVTIHAGERLSYLLSVDEATSQVHLSTSVPSR